MWIILQLLTPTLVIYTYSAHPGTKAPALHHDIYNFDKDQPALSKFQFSFNSMLKALEIMLIKSFTH